MISFDNLFNGCEPDEKGIFDCVITQLTAESKNKPARMTIKIPKEICTDNLKDFNKFEEDYILTIVCIKKSAINRLTINDKD
jgi:hypothetical protein